MLFRKCTRQTDWLTVGAQVGDAVVKLDARKEVVHASSDHQKVLSIHCAPSRSRCMLHAMRARRGASPEDCKAV